MPSAVFVFVFGDLGLMEQRPDLDTHFPNEWLFPGGKLQDGEAPETGFLREVQEELGVIPLAWRPVGGADAIYYARPGEQSHRLYPFLVDHWQGRLPTAVLDTGTRLMWRTLASAAASPIPCTAQIARAALDTLRRRAP